MRPVGRAAAVVGRGPRQPLTAVVAALALLLPSGRVRAQTAAPAVEAAERLAAEFRPGRDALGPIVDAIEQLAPLCAGGTASAAALTAISHLAGQLSPALAEDPEAPVLSARLLAACSGIDAAWRRWAETVQTQLFQQWLNAGAFDRVWANLEARGRTATAAASLLQRQLRRDRGEAFIRLGMLDQGAAELFAVRPAAVADDPAWHLLDLDRQLMAEAFESALGAADELLQRHGDLFAAPEARDRLRLVRAIALQRQQRPAEAVAAVEAVLAEADAPSEFRELAVALQATIAADAGDRDAADRRLASRLRADAPSDALEMRLAVWRQRLDGLAGGDGDRARAAAIAAELRREFDAMCRQWRAVPVQPGGMAFLQLGSRRDVLCLLWRALLLEDPVAGPARCLDAWLVAESLGSAARRQGIPAGTAAEVQRRLVPAGGVLLVYLPAPKGSMVLTVGADAIAPLALPGDVGLRRRVQQLRTACRDGDDAAVQAAAAAVQPWVLPDVLAASLHRRPRAMIAGRELLGRLPFAALPWPDRAMPWLGLHCALAYAPSLPLALRAASAQSAQSVAAPAVAVLGPVDAGTAAGSQWPRPPLPLGERDLWRALAHVAPSVCTVRGGRAADRAAVAAAAAATMGIVFAHGVQGEAFPFETGLLLAGGGDDGRSGDAVFAADFDEVPVCARLLVLCACATGRTSVRRGDAAGADLGSALLARGAHAVIAADDDLMLGASLRFAEALLAGLVEGQEIAEAVRAARVRAFSADGSVRDALLPQLHLDGLGFGAIALPPAPPRGWLLPALGASALLLVGGGWRRARRRQPSRRRYSPPGGGGSAGGGGGGGNGPLPEPPTGRPPG